MDFGAQPNPCKISFFTHFTASLASHQLLSSSLGYEMETSRAPWWWWRRRPPRRWLQPDRKIACVEQLETSSREMKAAFNALVFDTQLACSDGSSEEADGEMMRGAHDLLKDHRVSSLFPEIFRCLKGFFLQILNFPTVNCSFLVWCTCESFLSSILQISPPWAAQL